jgi:sugar/nucleoside kinase (ribokinase family)
VGRGDEDAGLAALGIDTTGIRLLPGVPSGVASISVDAAGENCIAVASGANSRFDGDGVTFPAPRPGSNSQFIFSDSWFIMAVGCCVVPPCLS